jgi:hypothetical protein
MQNNKAVLKEASVEIQTELLKVNLFWNGTASPIGVRRVLANSIKQHLS